MMLLFFNDVIKSDLAAAVAWTLLHSTWQGMVAAILAGLIILFTKKRTASFRYQLYSSLFLSFLLIVTITFIVQYNYQLVTSHHSVQLDSETVVLVTQENPVAIPGIPGMKGIDQLIKKTDILLHQYYPALFSVWLIVFASKLFFMLTGFRLMNRLRRDGVQPADIYWQNLVNRLCHSLAIQRHVQLLESARIKVPMMTGFFKPVILVPLGICCHLPASEMEAILLHELAHIRRSDYLMNLLQRFMETVFFFNPCILWISSLMRDERENCCDDIAVNEIRSKERYIHALVAFQEYNIAYHQTQAIAFAGSRQRLLYRVKRLLINENKKLNHMEKLILICSMVVLTAAFSISSGTLQAQNKPLRESQQRESADPSKNRNQDHIINEENNFEQLYTINSDNNGHRTTTITAIDAYGKKYVLRKTDGRITRLIIDNKEINENDFPEFKDIIEKIESGNAKNRVSKANSKSKNFPDDVEREMQLSREAELLAKQRRAMEIDPDRQRRELELRNHLNGIQNKNQHLIEERIAEREARQRDIGRNEDARLELRALQLHEKLAKERSLPLQRGNQLNEKENQFNEKLSQERMMDAQQEVLQQQKERSPDLFLQDRKIALEHHERLMQEQQGQLERKMELRARLLEQEREKQTNKIRNQEPESRTGTNNEIHSILETLEEKGVIELNDRISFTLNNKELIVNGKRQPDSVHKTLKERYIHNKGDHFIYEKNGNSTKTTINKN